MGKCGERLAASWHRASPETEPKHKVEGIHPIAFGRVGRDRLLYGGGSYLARAGHLLRLVLHSSAEPSRELGKSRRVSLAEYAAASASVAC